MYFYLSEYVCLLQRLKVLIWSSYVVMWPESQEASDVAQMSVSFEY